MKMLIAALMLLAIALPLCCMAEETIVPAATPAPVMLNGPEPTPQWLTVIETELCLGRHDYVEEIGHVVHTLPMLYMTTHLAEISAQNDELCEIWGIVHYSATDKVDFEMKRKLTAPDGTVTERTRMDQPSKAGSDENEVVTDTLLVKEAFQDMLEQDGHIMPGTYLYEMYIDGQLVGSHSFTVLECDYSPAYLDHDTFLYADPDCLIPLVEIPMGEDVNILDAESSGIDYLGYAFHVEWGELNGYVKCYDVMPKNDEWLLSTLESGKIDGVHVEYADIRVSFGDQYGYGVTCMTRGQAEYCAQMKDVNMIIGLSYEMSRSFIPEGLGSAVVFVKAADNSKSKTEKIELEDAAAKTAVDSAKMILGRMKKKSQGEYLVSIEIDGEEYANYRVSNWGDDPYVQGGHSKALDIGIYVRVILPDKTVFESTADEQTWNYFGDSMYNSYDGMELERVFEQMMQEGGIQTGIYRVEVLVENALVYSGEFEVLDDDLVLAEVIEPSSLYESKSCKKTVKQIKGGTIIDLEQGESVSFEAPSKYGDWTETHLAIPAKHKEENGYVDCDYLKMLTDEALPEYIQKMLIDKERPDWISLSISAPTTANVYAMGSASEETMTIGMASLAADHRAYKIRTYVYYSLKEDRNAQFEIKITRPDGVTFEQKKSHEPNYNMEDKSLFSDYSICDMLDQMKKDKGILPGSYHYEIRETGADMYIDGWFEILDVELALGETEEDAKLYASPNKSRIIARVPIYSDIFLYDDYRCEHTWYTAEYDDTSGSYIARVSWNGLMGYMEQMDYNVEADAGAELLERLGEETVTIESLDLVYSEGWDNEFVEMPLEAPLEYDQISRMIGSYGEVSVHAKMTYTSPMKEQLMLFTFMVQAPSGRQMAMSEMYVYFDKPGRASSENVLIDGGSIITLLERMGSQGMVEKGIYQYSVMMNGEVLAQTQFEVAPQGNYGAYYSSRWDSEDDYRKRMNLAMVGSTHGDTDAAYNAQVSASYDEVADTEASVSGEYGTVKIREGSNVNVRKKSNADSARVGIVKGGAEYPCVGIADNGWYKIELEDGTVGYVSNKMATIINE